MMDMIMELVDHTNFLMSCGIGQQVHNCMYAFIWLVKYNDMYMKCIFLCVHLNIIHTINAYKTLGRILHFNILLFLN